MSYDWTPERYRQRQPSCWDPPWTRRTCAYQHSSSYELDMYSPSPPRRRPTYWDPPVYRETPRQRPHTDDGDWEDMHHDDSVNTKLNRVIDCFDKFDSWREKIDRRFKNLDPLVMRGSDEFYYDDEIKESEYDDQRRRLTEERNYWRRNQNFGACGSSPHDERGRHDGRSRRGSCWDPPGGRQSRHQTGGFDNLQFNHSVSCWEPPPRRVSRGYSDYDQPPPPLQLVLDQQPQPSHRRSATPPPATAALPQPLHVEQRHSDPSRHQHTSHSNGQPWQKDRQLLPRSPSCCHPTTPLRQAEPYFELPTTVQQPLRQRPSSFQHLPSLCSATKLVSCEEKHLGVEADSDVLNHVDLQISGVELVDDDVHVVQVSVNDENIGDLIVRTHRELEMKEKETLLEVKEKDGSIGEVEKTITSFTVARVSSKDVENCWSKIGDGAYTGLLVIACVYVDLNVGDVNTMKHRSTSLDTDARLIPPRNNKSCLSILGGVNRLFILVRNFAGHIRSPWLNFYGGDRGIHSAIRYVFDPGGDASPKLLLSTIFVAS